MIYNLIEYKKILENHNIKILWESKDGLVIEPTEYDTINKVWCKPHILKVKNNQLYIDDVKTSILDFLGY